MNAITRSMSRTAAISSLLFFMAGCAGPQLFHDQLSALDKNQSPSETNAVLRLPPLSINTAVSRGRIFEFHRYNLNNGLQRDVYFLAYERKSLVFWGYITEFRRQPDQDLNLALTAVLKEIVSTK